MIGIAAGTEVVGTQIFAGKVHQVRLENSLATRDLYRRWNQLETSRGQRCDEKWDDWNASTSREWGSWDGGT